MNMGWRLNNCIFKPAAKEKPERHSKNAYSQALEGQITVLCIGIQKLIHL